MKRLLHLRRLLRLLPKLLNALGALESLWGKLDRLVGVLERLEAIDTRITELDVLHATASVARLESLDEAIKRIERVSYARPEPVVHANGAHAKEVKSLQVLSNFAKLSGKAKEIEDEWRQIQQDKFDAEFKNQVKNGGNEAEVAFRNGVEQGVKWCVKHFG